MRSARSAPKEVEVGNMISVSKSVSASLNEEITRLHSQGSAIANLDQQLENVQMSIDKLVMSLPNNFQQLTSEASPKHKKEHKRKKLLPLSSSNVINRQNFIRSPCSPLSTTQQVFESDIENKAPENDELHSNHVPCPSSPHTTVFTLTFNFLTLTINGAWNFELVPWSHTLLLSLSPSSLSVVSAYLGSLSFKK